MTNEERKLKYMNRNVKLFPPFLSLIWDVLFVFTITTMYFHDVKNFSYSMIMAFESVVMFAGCILSIPVAKLFAKVTPAKSLRIGLLGYAAFILLCIFGTNPFIVMVGYVFLAFGYCVISVKNNPLLTDSLAVLNRSKDYNRVSGLGISMAYIFEAVGAVAITYVYNIDPTLTFWISLGFVVFALIYSFLFKEPSKFQEKNVEIPAKEINDKTTKKKRVQKSDGYFKILSSVFVVSLLLYSFMFRGVVSIDTGAFKIFLQGLISANILPVWAFGCIYGIMKICVALSTKYQFKFNLKFGIRSLIIFNVLLVSTFAINGIMYLIAPTSIVTIVVIIISSCIQCSLRPPNFIFVTNYMQVCLPQKNLEKLYALSTVVQYFGYAVMTAMFSGLLGLFNDNYGYSVLTYLAICLPLVIFSVIFFIRLLCKKYAQKYTIIKEEYTVD